MDNRYNRHNRRKYSLKVHIVLVTKYRKQLLRGSITDDVKQKIYVFFASPFCRKLQNKNVGCCKTVL
jgi:REP element-mobilizing transposase RayT